MSSAALRRRFHEAGSTTRKLSGLAVVAVLMGAIDPSMRQNAGAVVDSACQIGAASVTAETGSPIAEA